jgi:hypothetical protein
MHMDESGPAGLLLVRRQGAGCSGLTRWPRPSRAAVLDGGFRRRQDGFKSAPVLMLPSMACHVACHPWAADRHGGCGHSSGEVVGTVAWATLSLGSVRYLTRLLSRIRSYAAGIIRAQRVGTAGHAQATQCAADRTGRGVPYCSDGGQWARWPSQWDGRHRVGEMTQAQAEAGSDMERSALPWRARSSCHRQCSGGTFLPRMPKRKPEARPQVEVWKRGLEYGTGGPGIAARVLRPASRLLRRR